MMRSWNQLIGSLFMRVCRGMFFAAAFVGLGSAGVSAQSFPAWGGPGDAHTADLCGQQQYFITGFKFRSGLWLDQLQIVCQRHNPDGTVDANRITPNPPRGGGGGGPGEIYCPPNQVVTRIDPALTPQRQIRGFTFNCGGFLPGRPVLQSQTFFVGAHYNSHTDDLRADLCEVFDFNAALGMNINFGKHVNGLGPICNKVVRAGDKPPVGIGVPPPPPGGFFAAVAMDGKGHWGASIQKDDTAPADALHRCGSGCKVVMQGPGRCVAVAQSKSGGYWIGYAHGDNKDEVQRIALKGCTDRAPPGSCRVEHVNCL
jgi:hypothetical protein